MFTLDLPSFGAGFVAATFVGLVFSEIRLCQTRAKAFLSSQTVNTRTELTPFQVILNSIVAFFLWLFWMGVLFTFLFFAREAFLRGWIKVA
jgi:hypothetical protein